MGRERTTKNLNVNNIDGFKEYLKALTHLSYNDLSLKLGFSSSYLSCTVFKHHSVDPTFLDNFVYIYNPDICKLQTFVPDYALARDPNIVGFDTKLVKKLVEDRKIDLKKIDALLFRDPGYIQHCIYRGSMNKTVYMGFLEKTGIKDAEIHPPVIESEPKVPEEKQLGKMPFDDFILQQISGINKRINAINDCLDNISKTLETIENDGIYNRKQINVNKVQLEKICEFLERINTDLYGKENKTRFGIVK